MKNKLTILFLMLTLASYSQHLTYGTGGTVYNSENKKVNSADVRQLMAENSEALALYNAGRSKKTLGNVFLYGGAGLVATNLIIGLTKDEKMYNAGSQMYPNPQSERTNMTAAIIGGALMIASIPIKIGYTRKIKSALEKYNNGLADAYSPEPKTTLVASANQIGLRIEF